MFKLIQVSFYMLTILCLISTHELWKPSKWDVKPNDESAQKKFYKESELCKDDSRICPFNMLENVAEKRVAGEESLVLDMDSALFKDEGVSSYLIPFGSKSTHCSCRKERRLVDLGASYFPRYYFDMVCLSGDCGLLHCRASHYTIWVLRKRKSTDVGTSKGPVPLELRDDWISESIAVTTNCECRP